MSPANTALDPGLVVELADLVPKMADRVRSRAHPRRDGRRLDGTVQSRAVRHQVQRHDHARRVRRFPGQVTFPAPPEPRRKTFESPVSSVRSGPEPRHPPGMPFVLAHCGPRVVDSRANARTRATNSMLTGRAPHLVPSITAPSHHRTSATTTKPPPNTNPSLSHPRQATLVHTISILRAGSTPSLNWDQTPDRYSSVCQEPFLYFSLPLRVVDGAAKCPGGWAWARQGRATCGQTPPKPNTPAAVRDLGSQRRAGKSF